MRTPFLAVLSLSLCLIVLAAPPLLAANRVDLADLDALGDTVLEELRDADHALALAQIHEAGAERREDMVKDALKSAKRERGAKEADVKAARAEMDAAKKNQDEARTRLAQSKQTEADRALAAAQAFEDWKKQEQQAAEEGVKMAKTELELREDELEYARANLVVRAKTDASSNYDLDAFRKDVENSRKKATDARSKWEREATEAHRLQEKWTSLPK